jgi:hypothetical protein
MELKKIFSSSSIVAITIVFFVCATGIAHAITIANFPAGFTFTKNLNYGMTDPDVMRLQQVLNTNTATRVAISGPGSSGNETLYFGPLTKAAVINFQQLYSSQILAPLGLTSGTGYVGLATRTKLNLILSSNTSSTACPTGYVCTPNNTNTSQNLIYTTPTYQSYYNTNNTTQPTTSLQPTVTLPANNQSAGINSPSATGTNTTSTQCPTGYVCTPNNQTSAGNSSSGTTNTSTGSTGTQTSFSLIASSPTTSTTASTSAKAATSTETLDYGTVTGVFPCTFNPGNFYVGFTVSSTTPIVPKTASSTTASSTTSTATTTKSNALGDKHYVWVLGNSQLYNGSITIKTIAATATSSSYTKISSTGSEVGGGFLPTLPPIGATLDMVIKKTNQSCSPQGSGYLIEKAYIRQPGL